MGQFPATPDHPRRDQQGQLTVVVPLGQIDPDLPFTTPDGSSHTGARTSLLRSPKELLECCFPETFRATENTCKNTSLELLLAREIFQVLSSHISLALCAVLKLLDSSLSNERLEPRD